MKQTISVVVPVYRCGGTLEELCKRVATTIDQLGCSSEIVLVNDCCPANSWVIIEKLVNVESNKNIIGINLSRNFGQHHAITAGIQHSTGDWLVVMDGDLQDIPEEIANLYKKAREGFDVVLAKRAVRNDSFIKKSYSRLFYKVFNFFVEAKFDGSVANFGIYSKLVIDNYNKLPERYRFFPLAISWLGFRQASINVEHGSRTEGKSSYSLVKLISLGLKVIINQTNKPLYLAMAIGFLFSLVSAIMAAALLYRAIFYDTAVLGWASLMISLFFLSGTILFSVGLLGVYIGNIFTEVKNRPLYVIQEVITSRN